MNEEIFLGLDEVYNLASKWGPSESYLRLSVLPGGQITPIVINTVLDGDRLNTPSWICSLSQTITKINQFLSLLRDFLEIFLRFWDFCQDLVSLPYLSVILLNNCTFNITLPRCERYRQRQWLDTVERNAGSLFDKRFFRWLDRYGRKGEIVLLIDSRSIAFASVAHTLPQFFKAQFVLCFQKWCRQRVYLNASFFCLSVIQQACWR